MAALATLTTTTLTNAMGTGDWALKPASTTGIALDAFLYIDLELLRVTGLLPGTQFSVRRGLDGTINQPHAAAALVTIGRADQFYNQDPPAGVAPTEPLVLPWINVVNGNRWTVAGGRWVLENPPEEAPSKALLDVRTRLTQAQIAAGTAVLPALVGYKYRLVDFAAIAIGGNAAGATAVVITGTQSATVVNLVTVPVANLTQSTVVVPATSGVTVLADGASFALNDANTAISVSQTGSPLLGCTSVDVCVSYTLESI